MLRADGRNMREKKRMCDMTKTELKFLAEIAKWRGDYSLSWSVKTRERLEAKGLVERCGSDHVRVTEAGLQALKAAKEGEA